MTTRRLATIVALAVMVDAPLGAQTPQPNPPDRLPLGSTLTVDALADLPSRES